MNLIDRDAYRQELEKAINRCLNATGRPDPVVLMSLQYAVAKLDSAPAVDAVPIKVIERYREKLIQHRDTLPQHTMRWMMVDEDICVVDEILKYSKKGDDDGTD